jgi:hypothetical protein
MNYPFRKMQPQRAQDSSNNASYRFYIFCVPVPAAAILFVKP